jgi:hypothetical protein
MTVMYLTMYSEVGQPFLTALLVKPFNCLYHSQADFLTTSKTAESVFVMPKASLMKTRMRCGSILAVFSPAKCRNSSERSIFLGAA